MPYRTISDLPEEQVDQYSTHQKHAFLKSFNSALEEYGGACHGRADGPGHARDDAGHVPAPEAESVLVAGFVALFAGAVWLERSQAFVGDEQFLLGMIPHHSAAVFMCREAHLTDPEVIDLCAQITSSQEAEIRQMEEILGRR